MKKLLLSIFLVFLTIASYSQLGLEGVTVEKYYVANAADNTFDPALPIGAVTYRIFINLNDNFSLVSVFGSVNNNQELRFETDATNGFYNNTDRGNVWAHAIGNTYLRNGTNMVDSWLSLGQASDNVSTSYYYGIPKTLDNGLNQIVNTNGVLQNNDPKAGIPLTIQDGILGVANPVNLPADPTGTPTLNPLLAMLDGTTTNKLFSTTDAAYYVTGGNMGANSENMVLIGQFTTEGVFTFKINIQVKNNTTGTFEYYVHENPAAGQFLTPALAQTLGLAATPPTVTNLTVNPGSVIVGGDVILSVQAVDNVSISQVEFFRGTTSLGVSPSSSSPYSLTWTSNSVGPFNITAVATDNEGTPATSPSVPLVVLPVPLNQPPVVDLLTVPATANVGTTINGSATAHDPDGSIQSIQFYVNNVPVGVPDPGAPYEFTYTAPATEQTLTIKAVATDNQGGLSADKIATVTVTDPAGPPYRVLSQTVSCLGSDLFYVPVITRPGAADVANIIGFDLKMHFNSTKVRPTGVIMVDGSLIADSTWTSYAVRQAPGDTLIISLFLNSKAPEDTFFAGHGNVLSVEFAKTPAFLVNDNVTFTVKGFVESYNTGIMAKNVDPGTFATFAEHIFKGRLLYWADASPIYYTDDPATSLITNIFGNLNPAVKVQPDMDGEFEYDIANGQSLSIDRNINDTADVQVVINGYDAYLTQKVVLEDPSFRPNVFQIMAMDVNRDGKISAGDVSQILQRATKRIGEFRQTWNYEDDGDKKPSMGDSYDWIFADNSGLYGDPRRFGVYAYESAKISASYPKDDGHGYSKFRATVWPANNLSLPVEGAVCPIIYSEDYQGVMYGDVDGSYKNLEKYLRPSLKKGSTDSKFGNTTSDSKASGSTADNETENATGGYTVTFDLSKSSYSDGYLTFPINVSGPSEINSLDFAMQFEDSKLKFSGIVSHLSGMQSDAYYDSADRTLRFSSFSMQKYSTDRPVMSVRFEANSNLLANEDIKSVIAYLNGNKATAEMSEMIVSEQTEKVKIYPNPAKDFVNIILTENADIELLDMLGRTIRTYKDFKAYEKYEINVASLPQGTYIMRIIMNIANEEFIATRKLVIKK